MSALDDQSEESELVLPREAGTDQPPPVENPVQIARAKRRKSEIDALRFAVAQDRPSTIGDILLGIREGDAMGNATLRSLAMDTERQAILLAYVKYATTARVQRLLGMLFAHVRGIKVRAVELDRLFGPNRRTAILHNEARRLTSLLETLRRANVKAALAKQAQQTAATRVNAIAA